MQEVKHVTVKRPTMTILLLSSCRYDEFGIQPTFLPYMRMRSFYRILLRMVIKRFFYITSMRIPLRYIIIYYCCGFLLALFSPQATCQQVLDRRFRWQILFIVLFCCFTFNVIPLIFFFARCLLSTNSLSKYQSKHSSV